MKNLLRIIPLVALAFFLGATAQSRAELNLDFELVNKTGFDIKAVFVAPNNQEEWDENILNGILENGETLEISFSSDQTAAKWDVMVVWTDDDAAYWRGYNLTEISKLTLFYDVENAEASATAE